MRKPWLRGAKFKCPKTIELWEAGICFRTYTLDYYAMLHRKQTSVTDTVPVSSPSLDLINCANVPIEMAVCDILWWLGKAWSFNTWKQEYNRPCWLPIQHFLWFLRDYVLRYPAFLHRAICFWGSWLHHKIHWV